MVINIFMNFDPEKIMKVIRDEYENNGYSDSEDDYQDLIISVNIF